VSRIALENQGFNQKYFEAQEKRKDSLIGILFG